MKVCGLDPYSPEGYSSKIERSFRKVIPNPSVPTLALYFVHIKYVESSKVSLQKERVLYWKIKLDRLERGFFGFEVDAGFIQRLAQLRAGFAVTDIASRLPFINELL